MNSAGRRPPDAPVLFLDRDIWSNTLGEALTAAGIAFVAHHERFKNDTPDEEWLAVAGQQDWVILTRDKNIRRRPNEIAALKAAKAIMFVLGQGNLSAAETASIVTGAYARLIAKAKGARRPAIFTLTRDGRLNRLKFR